MAAEPTTYTSGDSCPKCDQGVILVINTVVVNGLRHRYLGCKCCNFRPENNKQIVPLRFAPGRNSRHDR